MLLGMSRFIILIKLTLKYHLLCGIYTPLIPPLTNLVPPGQSCGCENTVLIRLDEFSRQSRILTALKIFFESLSFRDLNPYLAILSASPSG